jgi:hypothetical protein
MSYVVHQNRTKQEITSLEIDLKKLKLEEDIKYQKRSSEEERAKQQEQK